MKGHFVFGLCVGLFLGLISCQHVAIEVPTNLPQSIHNQTDTITEAQIELGRKLFFDPQLSVNNTISCKSCHLPEKAFTDGKVVSEGIFGRHSRHNASTLLNIAYSPTFMFDNRAQNLDIQPLVPIHDTAEMGENINTLPEKLNRNPEYKALSMRTFGKPLDAHILTVSLANYIRSLLRADSKYDQLIATKDSSAWTQDELQGMHLFFGGKAKCGTCHPAPLFTDFRHYDLGLETGEGDLGLMGATHRVVDFHRFKTPTLRNIAITVPYFHNGKTPTLNSAIGYLCNPNLKTKDYCGVALTKDKKRQLEAFLRTLTDRGY